MRWSNQQQTYINNNDLFGVYHHFLRTYSCYKDYWWEVVEVIWNADEKWSENYKIDLENRTITTIVKITELSDCEVEFCCTIPKGEKGGTYIAQHFDINGKFLWTKVGQTTNIYKRSKMVLEQEYGGVVKSIRYLAFYPHHNKNIALARESLLRNYFQKRHYLFGNDRFPTLKEITAVDYYNIKEKMRMLDYAFEGA